MCIAYVTLASGTKVSYREAGADNTTAIVQVHGLGTGHRNYDLLTPRLEPRLHVYDIDIDLDLPGYGDSGQAAHRRTMSDFADDVAQFVEALGLAPVHLHGTSMGGCIAMVLAGRRPAAGARRAAGRDLRVRPLRPGQPGDVRHLAHGGRARQR